MAKSKSKGDMPTTCGPDPKWQADDDVRTLERAEEIKAEDGRMKAAAKIAQEKSAAMNKVAASLVKRGLISDKAKAKIKSSAKN